MDTTSKMTWAQLREDFVWWEIRRVYYNGIMAGAGLLILLATHLFFPEDKNYVLSHKIIYIAWGLAYLICANFCFTIGYAFLLFLVYRFPELLPRAKTFYSFFFRLGLGFSIALSLLLGCFETWLRQQPVNPRDFHFFSF